ncbi:30S ribosomal protein S9 [bacterium]|nr:30S ribosomal protein S9 [bacterium]MBP5738840.1 30S ribosomal protein S9 [Abditibacteriota bacterium]
MSENSNVTPETVEVPEVETTPEVQAAPVEDTRVFTESYSATGRRKRSSARVVLKPGNGTITVNGRAFEEYFPVETTRQLVQEAFEAAKIIGKFDVVATVCGGGISGQAGAIRHGIARALALIDDATRALVKANGLLTRDAREKERKKYGQRGARARFQFSKR